MLQKLHGVVLYVVKYSDKSNIAHIYTEQDGQVSFLIPPFAQVGGQSGSVPPVLAGGD